MGHVMSYCVEQNENLKPSSLPPKPMGIHDALQLIELNEQFNCASASDKADVPMSDAESLVQLALRLSSEQARETNPKSEPSIVPKPCEELPLEEEAVPPAPRAEMRPRQRAVPSVLFQLPPADPNATGIQNDEIDIKRLTANLKDSSCRLL